MRKNDSVMKRLAISIVPIFLTAGIYFALPQSSFSASKSGKGLESKVVHPIQSPAKSCSISAYKTQDFGFSHDSDEVLLARMLFGEARDCARTEKRKIAYTALARAYDNKEDNGENLREAVLKKTIKKTKKGKLGVHQYSCFNKYDHAINILMDPERYNPDAWQECLDIARTAIAEFSTDNLKDAPTHYYNPDAMSLITKKVIIKLKNGRKRTQTIRYRAKPSWIYSPKMECLGRIKTEKGMSAHIFYRAKQ